MKDGGSEKRVYIIRVELRSEFTATATATARAVEPPEAPTVKFSIAEQHCTDTVVNIAFVCNLFRARNPLAEANICYECCRGTYSEVLSWDE
jgi:hypothetical protein